MPDRKSVKDLLKSLGTFDPHVRPEHVAGLKVEDGGGYEGGWHAYVLRFVRGGGPIIYLQSRWPEGYAYECIGELEGARFDEDSKICMLALSSSIDSPFFNSDGPKSLKFHYDPQGGLLGIPSITNVTASGEMMRGYLEAQRTGLMEVTGLKGYEPIDATSFCRRVDGYNKLRWSKGGVTVSGKKNGGALALILFGKELAPKQSPGKSPGQSPGESS